MSKRIYAARQKQFRVWQSASIIFYHNAFNVRLYVDADGPRRFSEKVFDTHRTVQTEIMRNTHDGGVRAQVFGIVNWTVGLFPKLVPL